MSTNIDTISKVVRFSEKNPRGFHSFQNGSAISDTSINKWIKECISDIQEQILSEENSVNPSAFRPSGNSMVTCIAYRKDDGLYEMTIVVTRDYFSAVVDDFDPKLEFDFVKIK